MTGLNVCLQRGIPLRPLLPPRGGGWAAHRSSLHLQRLLPRHRMPHREYREIQQLLSFYCENNDELKYCTHEARVNSIFNEQKIWKVESQGWIGQPDKRKSSLQNIVTFIIFQWTKILKYIVYTGPSIKKGKKKKEGYSMGDDICEWDSPRHSIYSSF